MPANDYRIAVVDQQHVAAIDRRKLKQVVGAVLQSEGIKEAAIGVALLDDRRIRELNRQYLQHDRATDVLSFTYRRDDGLLEGDIAVSVETAAREAERRGIPLETELAFYVAHGVLHLIGYNDATPDERSRMWQRQVEILRDLRYEDADRLL